MVVLDFFFACHRSNFIPISEANYARPREFKKKIEKTDAKAYFRMRAHCVPSQWAVTGRHKEIGNPYTFFFSFFHYFFSLATSQISYLLAKLIMLDPENLKKKVEKTDAKAYFRMPAHCVPSQWEGTGRQAEIGNPYTFFSFFHFFRLLQAKFHTY